MLKKILIAVLISLTFPLITSADSSGDLTTTKEKIFFSKTPLIENQNYRIYATIINNGTADASGNVKFILKQKNAQIGTDQPISVIAQKSDDVYVDWLAEAGNFTLIVQIEPWKPETDNPSNNLVEKEIFVDTDTDKDGIGNASDPDDDNDKIEDEKDAFPLDPNESKDTDQDAVGDSNDPDDDNDGIPDNQDAFPLNPQESQDTDQDGIGDNQDPDDDNDRITDEEEKNKKTNPKITDTDEDGYSDSRDEFPLNPQEWEDFDQDGVGDNADLNDDNDDLADETDSNDHNIGPVAIIKTTQANLGMNQETIFDASGSYDQDGYIKDFIWKVNGETVGKGIVMAYRPPNPGFFQVSLLTIDDNNEDRQANSELRVMNTKLIGFGSIIVGSLLLAMMLGLRYITKAKNIQ